MMASLETGASLILLRPEAIDLSIFEAGGINPDTRQPWQDPGEVAQYRLQHQHPPREPTAADRQLQAQADLVASGKINEATGQPYRKEDFLEANAGVLKNTPLLTAGEVNQVVSDAVSDVEEGFGGPGVGVYRDTLSPTGYTWGGGDKVGKPVTGTDRGQLDKAIAEARRNTREQALHTRHGSGIAPPAAGAPAATPAAPGQVGPSQPAQKPDRRVLKQILASPPAPAESEAMAAGAGGS